jgi:uncharacterized membrane protein (Fun14 family)
MDHPAQETSPFETATHALERLGNDLLASMVSEADTWSAPADAAGLFNETFFLKLGFSFMVGLALGFALKMAFKLVLFVVGLILLGVFALQYVGILDVNWSGLEIHYDGWVDWLAVNAGAFFDFIGGNLTSAASFTAGLVMGLRL